MTNVTKLKAAVVGCGSIGSLYDEGRQGLDPLSHAGAYREYRGTCLVAGVDNNTSRRERFVKMWGVPAYVHYQEMLAREQPDIVSVCTWPDSHMEVAVAAADSGARGVFCEKPLADSLPNGRKLVEACESRNVSLAVNHLRRWDKAHQEVRSFLAQGKLGSLQHTTVHYTRGVANYGSHVADLLRFFFGEVDWVRAFNRLKEPDHDPSLDAYMRMRNGMGCALVSCPRDSLDVFDLDIIGSTGRLRIEEFGHTIRLHRVATQPEFPRRQAFIEASSPFSPSLRGMMLAAVDDLVGCVAQRKKTPLCTGQDGLAALEIVTALERSAAGDGEQVNLPLG